ncbi:DUF1740-domain-containing protein [Martensiomyces pterosporus]|nr:DUF1740-domain-containing protein [Martensiomyces pterosporus]
MSDNDDDLFPSFSSAPAAVESRDIVVYRRDEASRKRRKSRSPSRDASRRRHKNKRDGSRHGAQEKSSHRRHGDRPKSTATAHSHRSSTKLGVSEKSKSTDGALVIAGDRRRRLREAVDDGLISVDTHGDRNLLIYRGATRAGTPSFRRKGRRQVLGLGGGYRIADSEDGSLEIQLVQSHSRTKRYISQDWTNEQTGLERIAPAQNAEQHDSRDFIALPKEAQAEHTAPSLYDSTDPHGVDFRSLDGMAKPPPGNAQPLGSTDDGSAQSRETSPLFASASELERRLKEDKRDIGAWLAYIKLQEQIMLSSFSAYSKHRARRSVAEAQVEMYRRAMDANPESLPLALGYLAKCRDIYDDEAVLAEWDKVLRDMAHPDLAIEYVNYCQSLATKFSVSNMDAVYSGAIRQITRALHGNIRDPSLARRLSTMLVGVIHRACLMLREAGYVERSISAYQAVLEWYVLTPGRLQSSPFSHRKAAFEEFWDSGVARIGAEGAPGWDKYDVSCSQGAQCREALAIASVPREARSVDEWYESECRISRQHVLPEALPVSLMDRLEMADNADPFALAIFEDVEHFLIDIPWDLHVACVLVDNYLRFLGLVGPQTRVLSTDAFLPAGEAKQPASEWVWTVPGNGDEVLSVVSELSIWPPQEDAATGDGSLPATQFPLVLVPVTLDTADTSLPYRYSCPWLSPSSSIYRDLVRNSLHLLRSAARLDHSARIKLCMSLMEWTFAASLDQGKSLSKQLLSEHPTCLPLWNSLAKCNARNGSWSDARKIWCSALASVDSLPEEEQPWAVVLRKSWAVLEATHGRGLGTFIDVLGASDATELQGLAQPGSEAADNGGTLIQATRLLRAKKSVDQAAAAATSARTVSPYGAAEIQQAAHSLHMWLAYAAERNILEADSAYAALLEDSTLNEADADSELLAMEICSIHMYHSRTAKVYKAAYLRKHLQEALALFPHNTALWEMLLHSESRARIENRVHRQMWASIERSPLSTGLHLLDIYIGLNLHRPFNPNIVRWALKKATRGGECRSPLVWAIYVIFECRQKSLGRARRAFYSAIRQCPWAKPLYLLALGQGLETAFTGKEKAGIVRAMVAAEIRTRAGLAAADAPGEG